MDWYTWFDGHRPGTTALVLGTNVDLLQARVEADLERAEADARWWAEADAWRKRRVRERRREVPCWRRPKRARMPARVRTNCRRADVLAGFGEHTRWGWMMNARKWCKAHGVEPTEAAVLDRMRVYARRRRAL